MRAQTIILVLSISSVWTAIVFAHESETPSAKGTPDQWVVQLDASEFEVREHAITQLMLSEEVDEGFLRETFLRSLTPEQRHRLIRVALHKYFLSIKPSSMTSSSQAGVGLETGGGESRMITPRMDEGLDRPAFLVTDTIPGFPAYVWLRPGDLILAVGGKPMFRSDDFSELIREYEAGEDLEMTIRRNGVVRTVTMHLDSFQRLEMVYEGVDQSREEWARSQPGFRRYLASILPESQLIPHVQIAAPSERAVTAEEPSEVRPGEAI